MQIQKHTSLSDQRFLTPRETPAQRQAREQASLKVARQMLLNGCDSNAILRYTGLTEVQLRGIF